MYQSMNPDADVTYQTVNIFSSDKCFIKFTSDVQHYIRWNQQKTICIILVKIDVLDTCGAIGITFLLFVMKIENTVNASFRNNRLLLINGLIFGIMKKFKITSLLNLNEYHIPMLAPLSSVNDRMFSWLRNVFFMSFQDWLNSVQQFQLNFTEDAGQRMFISWQTYEG